MAILLSYSCIKKKLRGKFYRRLTRLVYFYPPFPINLPPFVSFHWLLSSLLRVPYSLQPITLLFLLVFHFHHTALHFPSFDFFAQIPFFRPSFSPFLPDKLLFSLTPSPSLLPHHVLVILPFSVCTWTCWVPSTTFFILQSNITFYFCHLLWSTLLLYILVLYL